MQDLLNDLTNYREAPKLRDEEEEEEKVFHFILIIVGGTTTTTAAMEGKLTSTLGAALPFFNIFPFFLSTFNGLQASHTIRYVLAIIEQSNNEEPSRFINRR